MFQQVAERLSLPITLLLVVGIAYTLADGVWFFVAGPTPPADSAEARQANAKATPNVDFDVERVAAAQLFGAAQQQTATAAPVNLDAPQTKLALQLLGVFQANIDAQSGAVIAEQRQEGEVYWIGQRVPGNATLVAVHDDRVVIRRGEVFETLRFPEDLELLSPVNAAMRNDYVEDIALPEPVYDEPPPIPDDIYEQQNAVPPEPDPNAQSSFDNGGGVRQVVENYRQRLQQDPQSVLSEVGVQPVDQSAARGYRVGDASGVDLSRVGLQAGDVVLSVNGRPVGDVRSDQQQIDAIVAAGSARLEIQRGNRRFFVTATLQ